MDKYQIIDKVNNKGDLAKKDLLHMLKLLPNYDKVRPNNIKKGDVYMHPIFQHPYIFIEEKDSYWICTLLTSDSKYEQVLEKCDSRFFTESYITKTLFTLSEKMGSFMGVYDNNRHLSKITKNLKNIMK